MKESLKIARAIAENSGSDTMTDKFNLNMGPDEVAELRMAELHFYMTSANNLITVGIYQKSDAEDIRSSISSYEDVKNDKNWLYWRQIHSGIAAYTGPVTATEVINYPEGLFLIRPPRLAVVAAVAVASKTIVTLHYRIHRQKDISRLLMKRIGK